MSDLQDVIDAAQAVIDETGDVLLARALAWQLLLIAASVIPGFVIPIVGKRNDEVVQGEIDDKSIADLHTIATAEKVEATEQQQQQ